MNEEYDALVKKLKRQQDEAKATEEKIKVFESKKLEAFLKVFERSYKGEFKDLILKTDKKVLQKTAENIVNRFDSYVSIATNNFKDGDSKVVDKNQNQILKPAQKVQNNSEPDNKKIDLSKPSSETMNQILHKIDAT